MPPHSKCVTEETEGLKPGKINDLGYISRHVKPV